MKLYHHYHGVEHALGQKSINTNASTSKQLSLLEMLCVSVNLSVSDKPLYSFCLYSNKKVTLNWLLGYLTDTLQTAMFWYTCNIFSKHSTFSDLVVVGYKYCDVCHLELSDVINQTHKLADDLNSESKTMLVVTVYICVLMHEVCYNWLILRKCIRFYFR